MNDNIRVTMNEYLPLRDIVFNNIRDAITTGELKQGERLLEKQLSEKIGVSRTPIREALRKLEIEGFVEMIPRKGAMVAVISEKDIGEVLDIRACLEALAARLACQNMTDEILENLENAMKEFETAASENDIDKMAKADTSFHDLIFEASYNNRLVQLIYNLREQIHRFRIVYLNDKKCIRDIIKEHSKLMAAMRLKDSDKAAGVAHTHIVKQKNAVIKLVRVKP